MSLLRFLVETDATLGAIQKLGIELPLCQSCRNSVATVPITIGQNDYDLCVSCSARVAR